MNISNILSKVDHTLLNPTATAEQIIDLCHEAMQYKTASVCIPPCFVKMAKDFVGDKMKVCTVIGFPNGYNSTSIKLAETKEAIADGADEIDMVINIGDLKSRGYDKIKAEINEIKLACDGKILKVIIETCMLTDDEKIKMCEIVSNSNADYIKTSTGFGGGGATASDIKLFAEHITNGKKIKAAGGISSLEDAEMFINLGADRLGTSRVVKLAKSL